MKYVVSTPQEYTRRGERVWITSAKSCITQLLLLNKATKKMCFHFLLPKLFPFIWSVLQNQCLTIRPNGSLNYFCPFSFRRHLIQRCKCRCVNLTFGLMYFSCSGCEVGGLTSWLQLSIKYLC